MKQTIRLTESQFKKVITETIKKVLREQDNEYERELYSTNYADEDDSFDSEEVERAFKHYITVYHIYRSRLDELKTELDKQTVEYREMLDSEADDLLHLGKIYVSNNDRNKLEGFFSEMPPVGSY